MSTTVGSDSAVEGISLFSPPPKKEPGARPRGVPRWRTWFLPALEEAKRQGLPYRDLSRRIDARDDFVSSLRNGLPEYPSAAQLQRLAEELGAPAAWVTVWLQELADYEAKRNTNRARVMAEGRQSRWAKPRQQKEKPDPEPKPLATPDFLLEGPGTPLADFMRWAFREMLTRGVTIWAASREAFGNEDTIRVALKNGFAMKSTVAKLAPVFLRELGLPMLLARFEGQTSMQSDEAHNLENRRCVLGLRDYKRLRVEPVEVLTRALLNLADASYPVDRRRNGRSGHPGAWANAAGYTHAPKLGLKLANALYAKDNPSEARRRMAPAHRAAGQPIHRASHALSMFLRRERSPDVASINTWAEEVAGDLGVGTGSVVLMWWKPRLRRLGISIGARGPSGDTDHPKICTGWMDSRWQKWPECATDPAINYPGKPDTLRAGHVRWHRDNKIQKCPMPTQRGRPRKPSG